MPEAKLKRFQFKSLRFDFDDTVSQGKNITSQMNVQFGCPKDSAQRVCGVRIRFRLASSDGLALSLAGDATVHFELPDFEGEITKAVVEETCWKKAYEEYSVRITTLMKTFGFAQKIKMPSFDSLTPEPKEGPLA